MFALVTITPIIERIQNYKFQDVLLDELTTHLRIEYWQLHQPAELALPETRLAILSGHCVAIDTNRRQ
jgi:hypothetical protein